MPSAARRVNRIHIPSIDVTFRDDVSLRSEDVWREDRLHVGEGPAAATYLVLDFGVEERVETMQADLPEDQQEWRPTGLAMVEIQRVDPVTGAGMSEPTFKEIAGEEGSTVAWYGWTLEKCSPRRPSQDSHPETTPESNGPEHCLMCGSGDVVYHDADGTPRCQRHIGESPRITMTGFEHFRKTVGWAQMDEWMLALTDDQVAAINLSMPDDEEATDG